MTGCLMVVAPSLVRILNMRKRSMGELALFKKEIRPLQHPGNNEYFQTANKDSGLSKFSFI
jgi:hypothetical protein